MHDRLAGTFLSIVVAASAAACGGSAPSASPSPSVATSFDEYATAFCSAWGTLFRVVGNPETASWTDGVRQLQVAAEARDDATAAGLQGLINNELDAAREQIAFAAGWPPAARQMAQMDQVFLAMEIWITAYVDVAKGVPNTPDPQAALEAAGAMEAWVGMLEAHADITPYRPASVEPCPGAPISP